MFASPCRLCELFNFLCLIDMYFCLAFSSSYQFSLGLKGVSFANLGFKGVISFTVFIGNWYSNGLVSYYCSLVFLLQNAFQGDYIGFITRRLSLYWFGPILPFDPKAAKPWDLYLMEGGERMVPNSTAYFPNFKESWKPRSKSVFRQNLL